MSAKVIPLRRPTPEFRLPPPELQGPEGFFLYNFDKISPILDQIFHRARGNVASVEMIHGPIAVSRLSDGRFEAIVPGKRAFRSKSKRYIRAKLRQLGFDAAFGP